MALAVKIAMPFSFNCFCCSVARTKPYKKHHKKDHVALYQYVICGPGQSAGQYWGNTKSCEIWEKNDTNLQFYHFFINPGPRVLLLF